MKKLIILFAGLFFAALAQGQNKAVQSSQKSLPDLKACMHTAQQNLPLFTSNIADHSQEHDVNSIILDIERYIDSMPKSKSYGDQLLLKHFIPMRHFFLTTTNKTTVAAEFLYTGTPYNFCMYNDTALTLYISAVKDDDTYDLSKMTDKRIARKAFNRCLLPSLTAFDSLKDDDIKYVSLSIYYGCKDTREGAPPVVAVPYCLTLIARLSDVQQYATGLLTDKGLLSVSEVYLADTQDVRRITIE